MRNVTDVDDDILRKSRELGVHYLDLAAEEMARFDAEMGMLNLLPVYSEPRATSAISEILSLIGAALDAGHAYESGGSVYFDVATLPPVRADQRVRTGRNAAVGCGERRESRRSPQDGIPLDFVLWQPSLPDEPAWESRWGAGRPGWHIECSALALRELGETIDIHGGGRDLVFPHHECETAQSEAVTGQPVRPALVPRRPGRPRRDEDVEVARQPGLRGRALQGVGAAGRAAGAPGPPLPPRLGLGHHGRHAAVPRPGWPCGGPRWKATVLPAWPMSARRSTTTWTPGGSRGTR